MTQAFRLIAPRVVPPLDDAFRPAALANRAFLEEVDAAGGGVPLVFGLERDGGAISRMETRVLPLHHARAQANLAYAERLLKFLLWQKGGWRAYVGGPDPIGEHLRSCYAPEGSRSFDRHVMGEDVYELPFSVVSCEADGVPAEKELSKPLGRHLDGCRVGFDLGASDRKVSAVVDGEPVYSEEVAWDPRVQTDPGYHFREILGALHAASRKMPRVDAIGGSAAGIYINNQVRIASLFRGVPKERYGEVRTLFQRLRQEMGVPLEIVNDGDVTALAGSMSLGDNPVLGIAMGSSEAGGYVNREGNITGWLNELAFAPVDYAPSAPVDEWSGDRGVGALYLSQQCVFRLAPLVGIDVPASLDKAAQLEHVQGLLERGKEGAEAIWTSIGVYLGYAVAHYANFYDLKHVLILGRCTSGKGGGLILTACQEVLGTEFPELAARVSIQLPDERSRRVGQSIAAASLPAIA